MGFFAHCILSRIERKDLKSCHVALIFTGLVQDLTPLAHKNKNKDEVLDADPDPRADPDTKEARHAAA